MEGVDGSVKKVLSGIELDIKSAGDDGRNSDEIRMKL